MNLAAEISKTPWRIWQLQMTLLVEVAVARAADVKMTQLMTVSARREYLQLDKASSSRSGGSSSMGMWTSSTMTTATKGCRDMCRGASVPTRVPTRVPVSRARSRHRTPPMAPRGPRLLAKPEPLTPLLRASLPRKAPLVQRIAVATEVVVGTKTKDKTVAVEEEEEEEEEGELSIFLLGLALGLAHSQRSMN